MWSNKHCDIQHDINAIALIIKNDCTRLKHHNAMQQFGYKGLVSGETKESAEANH